MKSFFLLSLLSVAGWLTAADLPRAVVLVYADDLGSGDLSLQRCRLRHRLHRHVASRLRRSMDRARTPRSWLNYYGLPLLTHGVENP